MSRLGLSLVTRLTRPLLSQGRAVFAGGNPCLLATQAKWNKSSLDDVMQSNKLVVFMKGTPDQPMCGFSRAVVQILEMHGVDKFQSYDILEDEDLRQEIKDYSQWPTIPQVFMGGEFVGGCDIMIEMHKSGDLIDELEKIGHKSALLEEEDDKN